MCYVSLLKIFVYLKTMKAMKIPVFSSGSLYLTFYNEVYDPSGINSVYGVTQESKFMFFHVDI